jgi:hypothetical protein
MATASGKTHVIGITAYHYANCVMPPKKVVTVVHSTVSKGQMIELLARTSYCMDIYTVAEFYTLLPPCDVLIIDECDYMVN